MPSGWLPGQVIGFTNMAAPNTAKRLADTYWRGKHIEPNGQFINQWKNRQALASQIVLGPSYTDGQTSIVFEYPRLTPLFGPMRDEYREIAPGLFLGKMYRRVPNVKFLGFNYLRMSDAGWVTEPLSVDAAPLPLAGSVSDPAATPLVGGVANPPVYPSAYIRYETGRRGSLQIVIPQVYYYAP